MIENASKLQPLAIMRPRFSLKWLLIVFTILGIAFYAALVRPTFVANRFVNAIDDDDYSVLDSAAIFVDWRKGHPWLFEVDGQAGFKKIQIRARLVSRSWMDLLTLRRRIWLELCFHEPTSEGLPDEWQVMDLALAVAGPARVYQGTFELNDAFPR